MIKPQWAYAVWQQTAYALSEAWPTNTKQQVGYEQQTVQRERFGKGR